jgi:hypothetical protein
MTLGFGVAYASDELPAIGSKNVPKDIGSALYDDAWTLHNAMFTGAEAGGPAAGAVVAENDYTYPKDIGTALYEDSLAWHSGGIRDNEASGSAGGGVTAEEAGGAMNRDFLGSSGSDQP